MKLFRKKRQATAPILCPCPQCGAEVQREKNANSFVYIFVCRGCESRFLYHNGTLQPTNGHAAADNCNRAM